MITSPRRKLPKRYIATLRDGALDADAAARFAAGLTLSDGTVCRPAGLERVDAERVAVVLREGRYHQVKRMLGHCGGYVVALHREAIGPLVLDPALPAGACRELTDAEIAALRAAVHDELPSAEPHEAPAT
jgi:16S rRNA pseudouridine516 synthase